MVFPVAEVVALVVEGTAFSKFDGEEWPVQLKMWPCWWSRRKGCCRCLKRARGHRRSWHLWPLCRRLPLLWRSVGPPWLPAWCPAPWAAMMVVAVVPPISIMSILPVLPMPPSVA